MTIEEKIFNINNDIISNERYIKHYCNNSLTILEVKLIIYDLKLQKDNLLIQKERKDKLCQLMKKYVI